MTHLEGHPQCPRRFDGFRVRPYEADAGGRHAVFFYVVAKNADGARAARSDGQKQGGIDPVFLEKARDFCRTHLKLLGLMGGADRVMKIGQAADDAFFLHLAQAVEREHDVPVPLETAAVEAGREM